MLFRLFYFCVWRSPFLFFSIQFIDCRFSFSASRAMFLLLRSLWPLEGQCHTVVNLNSGRGKSLEEFLWLGYHRFYLDSCLMLRLPRATNKSPQLPVHCGPQLGSGSAAWLLCALQLGQCASWPWLGIGTTVSVPLSLMKPPGLFWEPETPVVSMLLPKPPALLFLHFLHCIRIQTCNM